MQIILEGTVTKSKLVLSDQLHFSGMFILIASRIGMTRLGDPAIYEYSGEYPHVSGLSGIQLISESHIAAHTCPSLDYIYLDIFSCNHIESEHIQWVKRFLGLEEVKSWVIHNRGHNFNYPQFKPWQVPVVMEERHG